MLYSSMGLLSCIAALSSPHSGDQAHLLTNQVPGCLSLFFQLIILPSQSLMPPDALAILTEPFIKFCAVAPHPRGQSEFATAMLECIESPEALQMFQERSTIEILSIVNGPPSGRCITELTTWVFVPFYLSSCEPITVYPVQLSFAWAGMVPVIAKVMAFAQSSAINPDYFVLNLTSQCALYVHSTIQKEGSHYALEALKGSSGILFSISRA
ncbi:hypothetical protein C8J56DRAFT_1131505 [Mycena floridula]|nr:hypothetical protein C8J56DRAFT_1131505 [Mycena floridula]